MGWAALTAFVTLARARRAAANEDKQGDWLEIALLKLC